MALSPIKIPEKVYVGFQGRRSEDEVPLGFMTPYTDDQAGIKRRQTVDDWANGYGRTKTFNSVVLENKPMVGFKIGRSVRRSGGWNGSGASYVRIEDPRGFELEITIENLVMCMSISTVENGEIMTECAWGRDGNRNILLPVESEPYRNSVQTKVALSKVISLRECKPGDEVELAAGGVVTYLGSLTEIEADYYHRVSPSTSKAKRYGFISRDGSGKRTLNATASMKVIAVTKAIDQKLTPLQIDTLIAEVTEETPGINGGSDTVILTASKTFERLGVAESQITLEEARKLAVESEGWGWQAHPSFYVSDDHKELLVHYYQFDEERYGIQKHYWLKQQQILTNGLVGYTAKTRNWGNSSGGSHNTTDHIELADVKHVTIGKYKLKLETGVEVSYYV